MQDTSGRVTLHPGDCLETLDTLPEASIDSVCCDPPYHLTSIVKRFGGPNAAPAKYGTDGVYARQSRGFMSKTWDGGDIAFRPDTWARVYRVLKPGGYLAAFGGTRTFHRLACAIEDAGFDIREMLVWAHGQGFPKSLDVQKACAKTPGAEQFAEAWRGFGTALKPALEPICLARKPLIGTVVENVLTHGTGGLNIGACRIAGLEAKEYTVKRLKPGATLDKTGGNWRPEDDDAVLYYGKTQDGRFPANLMHDGSPEVLAGFPFTKSGSIALHHVRTTSKTKNTFGERAAPPEETFGDSGSAARFFYCAKASKKDRAGSKHPTVKPVNLMRWLCRLVTPPGGIVLDPFAGSGTTGAAALAEGFSVVLCEREEEYLADIRRRLGLEPEVDIFDLGDSPDFMDLGGETNPLDFLAL